METSKIYAIKHTDQTGAMVEQTDEQVMAMTIGDSERRQIKYEEAPQKCQSNCKINFNNARIRAT